MPFFETLQAACIFLKLQAELDHLVKEQNAEITYCDYSSCVTVVEQDGSFIATADYDTREENMRQCILWLRRTRR
jgi:hypothetical protein